MLKKKILLPLLLFITKSIIAQEKITLEQIWGSDFKVKSLEKLQAMKNKNQYTVLNYDKPKNNYSIDLYDYATLTKVTSLINSKDFKELNEIQSYTFDASENKILIAQDSKSIYRRSFTAKYFIFDISTKQLSVFTDKAIQEPTFSKDGTKICYFFENNLYMYDLITKKETQISKDGKNNEIINGITDWVYEEEFGFVKAFDWNQNSDKIAYIKFNETNVPEFSMDIYSKGLYPKQQVFKYPKAGEKNSEVSLHIYNVISNTTNKIDLGEYKDFYIPRIQFTNDKNTLAIQIMNRHQNNLDLIFVDASKLTKKIILNEKSSTYIDITDDLTFLKDNSFIWTSEKDGFNHIYYYSSNGNLINRITKGSWDVTSYYGIDEKNKKLYYQSVENGSINRDIYAIQLNGKGKIKLTSTIGTSQATFSPNYQYFINSFSSAINAPIFTLNETQSGKEIKKIVTNEELEKKLQKFNLPQKEFITITTEKGIVLNSWILKPNNFDATKKYPLFMFQYSGPGSQRVQNIWNDSNDYWFKMLAQNGYVIACVDGRGTGYKGEAFKKCTYKELGKYEVIDQIDAAIYFGKQSFIDKTRIGIFGWSYGGFMASNCLFQGSDVFKTAIAVAPVTSWRLYDSIYTERYMQTPQENVSGYDQNSPITHASKLKGNYLLIHGSGDDNVHVQNSMQLIEALVQANKKFDWAIYPDKRHGISGGKTRLQLYTKMTDFILEKL